LTATGKIQIKARDSGAPVVEKLLVEPGPTRTGFGGALVRPAPLAEYADTPAAQLRQAFEEGSWVIKGDPLRMADAMLDAAGQASPPLRLILGAEAHAGVSRALESRLAELRNQQQSAAAADFSPEEFSLY
jgi:hypothetical protein